MYFLNLDNDFQQGHMDLMENDIATKPVTV